MNYEKFLEEFKETIFTLPVITEADARVVIHLSGEKAEPGDSDTELFIRNTNMKYFSTESDSLLGDFAELILPALNDTDKTNFIRFEIRHLYDLYCSNGWDEISDYIGTSISYAGMLESSAENVIDSMYSYEKIRDRLIVRPLNYKQNKAQLEGFVYKTIGDIALVLYAVVLDDEQNSCLNTIKIPYMVFEKWNIDKENLLVSTLINTNVFAMPRLYTNIFKIESTSEEESAFMAADFPAKSLKPDTIPLLTTTRKTNGAIAAFYPGVKEKIAEMFGDSFYVAFTSIHEAMIHKIGTVDPSDIRRHVMATNRAFSSDETLSDNVFLYDCNTRVFSMVTD